MSIQFIKILAYKRLYAVFIAALTLDVITKSIVIHYIPKTNWESPPITVIEGFFDIVHVNNKGAAWGILSGYGSWLGLLGIIALCSIYFFRKDLELKRNTMQIIFGLMTAGITGNVMDRMLYGHVVDFIDFHVNGYHWPAFNIADSCITLGVASYMIITFIDGRNAEKNKVLTTNTEQ